MTFVECHIVLMSSPNKVESYMLPQECLKLTRLYLFREAVGPREKWSPMCFLKNALFPFWIYKFCFVTCCVLSKIQSQRNDSKSLNSGSELKNLPGRVLDNCFASLEGKW